MKIQIIKLLICSLLIIISSERLVAQAYFETGKTAVVAHRGDWRNAPENSLQSILNCIEAGVNMVEIDIKKSKDNVLILLHDNTLDRTTTGKGKPSDYTLSELKKMRLKNGIGIPTEHTIPTLEEALLVSKGKIWVNIDKGYDYFEEVSEILKKTQTEDQVIIKSSLPFDVVFHENKGVIETLYFMPVVQADKPDAINFVKDYIDKLHPKAFEICFKDRTERLEKILKLIEKAGAKIWINTLWPSICGGLNDDRAVELNEADLSWGEVLKMNASFIQTDRPKELIDYLKRKDRYISNFLVE